MLKSGLNLGIAWTVLMGAAVHALAPSQDTARTSDAGHAQAAEPSASSLLDVVPGDVWAVFTWRDLRGFEARLAAFSSRINLPLPVSPTLGAKAFLNMVDGWRGDGDVALALLPAASPQEESDWGARMALFLPTSDLSAMIRGLSPTPVDDRVYRVLLRGEPSCVARRGDFAVFAQNESVVRRVLNCPVPLRGRFNAHQIERYHTNDLSLWINVEAAADSGVIREFLRRQGARPALVDTFRSFSQFQVSARLAEEGISVETFWRGPRNAPQASRGVDGSILLYGLPAEGCALAGGMALFDRSAIREWLDPLIDAAVQENLIPGEKKEELQRVLDRAAAHVKGVGLGFYAPRPGADGVVAACKIVLTDGRTDEVLKTIEDYAALLRSGLFKGAAFDAVARTAAFVRDAEKLGDVSVHHLRFDISAVENVNAQVVRRILGREDLLIRVAVVGPRVAMTVGGGSEYMTSVLSTLTAGRAPLCDEPGIRSSARFLPSTCHGRWQIDVGRLERLVDAILTEVDQKPGRAQSAPSGTWVVGVQRAIGEDGGEWNIFVPPAVPQWLKDTLLTPPVGPGTSQSRP